MFKSLVKLCKSNTILVRLNLSRGKCAVLIFLLILSFEQNAKASFCAITLSGLHILSSIDQELSETILSLPDKGTVPQELYQRYGVNHIARAIVNRISNQEREYSRSLIKQNGHIPIDLEKDTDVILFFWDSDIESIATRGFLNQHETRKTSGKLNTARRIQVENALAGLNLGTWLEAYKLRPKSAFLNVRSSLVLHRKTLTPIESLDNPKAYGNIGAVFKKSVRARSTWTSGDSYSIYAHVSFEHRMETGFSFRGTFNRNSLPNFSVDPRCYEVQIYGELGFDEVDYFLVKDEELASQLTYLKKPIFLAIVENVHDRIVFKKGKQLYAGEDPSSMENLN